MPTDATRAAAGADTPDVPVSGDEVQAVPQEMMAESVHGPQAPPAGAAPAAAGPEGGDAGTAGRIPQEMMAESAGHKAGGSSA